MTGGGFEEPLSPQIVGFPSTLQGSRAFSWTEGCGIGDLGALGGRDSAAMDVDTGVRIIVDFSSASLGETHRFILDTVTGQMKDIRQQGDSVDVARVWLLYQSLCRLTDTALLSRTRNDISLSVVNFIRRFLGAYRFLCDRSKQPLGH